MTRGLNTTTHYSPWGTFRAEGAAAGCDGEFGRWWVNHAGTVCYPPTRTELDRWDAWPWLPSHPIAGPAPARD